MWTMVNEKISKFILKVLEAITDNLELFISHMVILLLPTIIVIFGGTFSLSMIYSIILGWWFGIIFIKED